MKIEKKKITDFTLCMWVLYGCKTRETSRDWHKVQLPKDNHLRNTQWIPCWKLDSPSVKKFPDCIVKRGNNTVTFDDLVLTCDLSTNCIKTPHHQILWMGFQQLSRWSWSGRPARPRPIALLPPRSNGKTRRCYWSCWAPDDGREDARNMLSYT